MSNNNNNNNNNNKPIRMTEEQYLDAEEDNQGLCLNCRALTDDFAELDAREYECPECGENKVYGVPEALIMGMVEFVETEEESEL